MCSATAETVMLISETHAMCMNTDRVTLALPFRCIRIATPLTYFRLLRICTTGSAEAQVCNRRVTVIWGESFCRQRSWCAWERGRDACQRMVRLEARASRSLLHTCGHAACALWRACSLACEQLQPAVSVCGGIVNRPLRLPHVRKNWRRKDFRLRHPPHIHRADADL